MFGLAVLRYASGQTDVTVEVLHTPVGVEITSLFAMLFTRAIEITDLLLVAKYQ